MFLLPGSFIDALFQSRQAGLVFRLGDLPDNRKAF